MGTNVGMQSQRATTIVKPSLLPTPSPTTVNPSGKLLAIKWISPTERQEHLSKGLCFNCDNKWVRGHKCPCQSMNQNFFEPNSCNEHNSSSFDQYQPLQSSVTEQLPQRSNENIKLEMLLNDSCTINEMLNHREQGANLAVQQEQEEHAVQREISKIKHAFIDEQYQLEEIQELICKLVEDVRNIREELAEYINSLSWNYPTFYDDDEEYSIQYKEYLENSSNAITPVLPTEEPECSLSMDECEVTFDNERERDVPVCEDSPTFDDYSEILSDSNNDDISNDDDAFEDIDEKLLSINHLIADIESLNDNPTSDCVLKSSSFPIFKESNISLSYSDNSSPELESFSDHTEETRSGSTTTHANNSLPEYDSFCFEIEPGQGRLTSVVMKDIYDDSSNDPLLEEVDLFLASDNSIPLGVENIDYDSEGISIFLKNYLSMIPFPFLKMSHLTLIIKMIRHFLILLRNHWMLSSLIMSPIQENLLKGRGSPSRDKAPGPWSARIPMWQLFKGLGVRIEQKSPRKTSKPDKIEHEIAKIAQKPDSKTFSVYSSQKVKELQIQEACQKIKVAHIKAKFTLKNTNEAQAKEITNCHPNNPCDFISDQTAEIKFHKKDPEGLELYKGVIQLGNEAK
uniref:Reverse transcriptase domain-containing protein n=1 Tax=Tanacetum cinerariifolium TaxID=118510 RepID=A0A6L2N713_TANCI|nr:hypothetical protein [Tanacetum cinerariifolium]